MNCAHIRRHVFLVFGPTPPAGDESATADVHRGLNQRSLREARATACAVDRGISIGDGELGAPSNFRHHLGCRVRTRPLSGVPVFYLVYLSETVIPPKGAADLMT